ncbi:MAG: glycosyltransferase family 2 protein [Acidobacteria bacterium]|nr:glycosyltransferase family 2 protein [Acidobacteriota bacterium]
MSIKLSILVVTWNSWGDLERLLESVLRADLTDTEILVFDNGSVDDTPNRLRACYGERVRLHVSPVNLGLPPAVNRGFGLVHGEYVMLLDVDTEVRADTAARLLEFMESHPEVALAAPRILTPEGRDEGTARNLPSVMNGLFGRQSRLSRMFPGNPFTRHYLEVEHYSEHAPYRVEQVSAACMFMRRSLLDEVGPWDEVYRCYWVDTDWCARLKRLGRQVYCVPQAKITHYENNRAGKKKSLWRIWHFHTGAFRLYRKHYTFGLLDPRMLVAGVALLARTALMVALNELKPANPPAAMREDRAS